MKLKVKVIPSASKDYIVGYLGDTLKIKVKAPPENGKANRSIVKLMKKQLKLIKGCVTIVSGTTSAIKIIEIKNSSEKLLNKKLKAICDQ